MKKTYSALKFTSILLLIMLSFAACEQDFSSLGTEIIGGTNFETGNQKYDVTTFNKRVDPVRSDNLAINLLGVYNDPIYGVTTANLVSQLTSGILNPSFGENVVLDSVVLTIPYFSTVGDNDDDGNATYTLDSIFGASPINITGYRNNYFLRDFDPDSDFQEAQKYYSDGATSQTGMINAAQLEGDLLFEVTDFVPTSDPIILLGEEDEESGIREVVSRDPPALRVLLDLDYWQQTIIDKEGEPELSNAANFEDYLRGVFFKVEPVSGNLGTMMALDLRGNSNITLHYTRDGITSDTGVEPEREQTTYALSFTDGNRVNLIDNVYNFPLEDGDDINGDEKLYLKGGVGSVAVINLFNGDENGESAEFTNFREEFVETNADGEYVRSKRLVNEANLVFYVDQATMAGIDEPDRIFLYDMDNKRPVLDYFLDPTTNNFSPIDSKTFHLQPLERVDDEPDGAGIRYKVRITEHVNNLLMRDSTNIKLGLAVSGNVNLENGNDQYDIITDEMNLLDRLPTSTIITPRGTVLLGNNTTEEGKKVQLEIFYTEPNN